MSPADSSNSFETVTPLATGINMNQQEKEEIALKIYSKMIDAIGDIYREMDQNPAYIYIEFPDRIIVDDTSFTYLEMMKIWHKYFNNKQEKMG